MPVLKASRLGKHIMFQQKHKLAPFHGSPTQIILWGSKSFLLILLPLSHSVALWRAGEQNVVFNEKHQGVHFTMMLIYKSLHRKTPPCVDFEQFTKPTQISRS